MTSFRITLKDRPLFRFYSKKQFQILFKQNCNLLSRQISPNPDITIARPDFDVLDTQVARECVHERTCSCREKRCLGNCVRFLGDIVICGIADREIVFRMAGLPVDGSVVNPHADSLGVPLIGITGWE